MPSKESDPTPQTPSPSDETVPEPKSLEEMIAAANAVELKARQSPRRKESQDATEVDASGIQEQADKVPRKTSSLASIWPF